MGHHVFDHHFYDHHYYYPFSFGFYYGASPYGYDYYGRSPGYTVLVNDPVTYVADDSARGREARPSTESGSAASQTTEEGLTFQRRAEAAFRAGRYDQGVRFGNHAAVEMPRNGKLFLFVAQALFALDDYRGAAGAVHRAMSLLDAKDWGYVAENFRRYYTNADYVEQVRRLEKFITDNPDAAYARFLLGYHYGFLGHGSEARRQLTKAVELESRDELARRLLELFGGTAPAPSAPPEGTLRRIDIPFTPSEVNHHDGHEHGGQSHHHGPSEDLPRGSTELPELQTLNPSATAGNRLISDFAIPLAVAKNRRSPVKPRSETHLAQLDPRVRGSLAKLTPADRAAALAQRVCPVTGDVLGSDGKPLKVRVQGRDVFVCCKGCVADLQKDPEKYLSETGG